MTCAYAAGPSNSVLECRRAELVCLGTCMAVLGQFRELMMVKALQPKVSKGVVTHRIDADSSLFWEIFHHSFIRTGAILIHPFSDKCTIRLPLVIVTWMLRVVLVIGVSPPLLFSWFVSMPKAYVQSVPMISACPVDSEVHLHPYCVEDLCW